MAFLMACNQPQVSLCSQVARFAPLEADGFAAVVQQGSVEAVKVFISRMLQNSGKHAGIQRLHVLAVRAIIVGASENAYQWVQSDVEACPPCVGQPCVPPGAPAPIDSFSVCVDPEPRREHSEIGDRRKRDRKRHLCCQPVAEVGIVHLVAPEMAALASHWVPRAMPEAPTSAEDWQYQEWTTWPAGPWIHDATAAYDRPRGNALRLLIRILLSNLPLERVQADPIHGKVPKTANPDGYVFHRKYGTALAALIHEPVSLSQLHSSLRTFVSSKTRTCRRGGQVPQHPTDQVKCALKWDGFWATEEEVQEACVETVLQYAACVLRHASVSEGVPSVDASGVHL